jgi:hypothetical protein
MAMDGMRGSKDFMTYFQAKEVFDCCILSGLCQGKLIAPLTFEGSCNRSVFEKWLEEQLLTRIKSRANTNFR